MASAASNTGIHHGRRRRGVVWLASMIEIGPNLAHTIVAAVAALAWAIAAWAFFK